MNNGLQSSTQVLEKESFARRYAQETISILQAIEIDGVEAMASGLQKVRDDRGRLFILGVGGSAGHAGHAVNDFRKICGFEAYSPTDNVSELTARINDEGWDSCFSEWLKGSRISSKDGVLVFSVGGGDASRNVSPNLVEALKTAKASGAAVFGVVGRDGGFTKEVADVCIVVPPLYPDRVTPHTEGLCAVLWHMLVSHPKLKSRSTMWEAVVQG